MLKNAFYITLFSIIVWGTYQISYPSKTTKELVYQGVYVENIINHIDKMTQEHRVIGSEFHAETQRYLTNQLSQMGLKVSKQKTTTINSKRRTAAPVRNIIAKLQGTDPDSRDLLLLAHYDAAKFSGTGASDDASGIAVILETLRVLLNSNAKPTNNILVVFTDAEEIGLLGAHAFINEQLSYHDIGLIINLEARGTSGPVMMWPETVGGNRAMIDAFQAAEVPMSVTSSLHYEIYKLLPNDTDLSPFNRRGKINGFNLAFIDNHFNYHTQLDDLSNLSLNTLAHQAIQFNAMLKHFSNTDLSQLYSEESLVYFNLPVMGLISYPTWVSWVLLVLMSLLLLWQMMVMIKNKQLTLMTTVTATATLIMASLMAYAWCWAVLTVIQTLFPANSDILQGFPYTGHSIMLALMVSALIIGFAVFSITKPENRHSQMMINTCIWLILCTTMVYYLPGSGLLIWPVLMTTLLVVIQHKHAKIVEQLAPITASLTCVLLGIILVNLPIALGISSLPGTAVIIVFLVALFIPVITHTTKSVFTSLWFALLWLMLPMAFLTYQLYKNPSISQQNPHPTSISYLYDVDTEQAHFYNYDAVFSGWNEALFKQKSSPEDISTFRNKYHQPAKNLSVAEPITKLDPIKIAASMPLQALDQQIIDLEITTHGHTEILEIYTQAPITLNKLTLDNRTAADSKPKKYKAGQRILQYHLNGKKSIELQVDLAANDSLQFQFQSHSVDLLNHPEISVTSRPEHQIPKAFIKSDNTVVVQSFAYPNNE